MATSRLEMMCPYGAKIDQALSFSIHTTSSGFFAPVNCIPGMFRYNAMAYYLQTTFLAMLVNIDSTAISLCECSLRAIVM